MNHESAYHLLCDESEGNGTYFSDFYGGVLVGASQLTRIENELRKHKTECGFHGEVKWGKVTERYVERYERLMGVFFDYLRVGDLKMRIMFRSQALIPVGLTSEHRENSYFILYYEFIKHAFGFAHRPSRLGQFSLHLWFDRFPDKQEKVEQFKRFLIRLQKQRQLRLSGLRIDSRHITEVDSHDHALVQCLDVILGAMAFRLNDRHLEKKSETGRRGKRTIAKERLYKHILREIYTLKPGFNIGMTTGCTAWPEDLWRMPYRHWRFEPRQRTFDPARSKLRSAKVHPAKPTKGPGA